MQIESRTQIYDILHNLKNTEIAFDDYSGGNKDYTQYGTYIEYFNNSYIRNNDLSRFYFPSLNFPEKITEKVSGLKSVSEQMLIIPEYDFTLSKLFSYTESLLHTCEYYSMIYLMENSAVLQVDNSTFELKQGDFFIIPPEIPYAYKLYPESIAVCFNIKKSFINKEYKYLSQLDRRLERFLVGAISRDPEIKYITLHTKNSSFILNSVLDIFIEYIRHDDFSKPAMRSLFALLMMNILREDDTIIEPDKLANAGDRLYQELERYLRQKYPDTSLDDVSDHFHFSKQYICKIVRNNTGDTFQNLLTNIRLENACLYITDTSLSMEDIATLCGFSTSAFFSKCFKHLYSMTPSEYRRKEAGFQQ